MAEDKKQKRAEIAKSVAEIALGKLHVQDVRGRTMVYIIAVDKRVENNRQQSLPCHSASHINGFVYDAKNDAVIVNCADFRELGWIDGSFVISFEGCGGWRREIPLPPEALAKLFTSQQLRVVRDFAERYSNPVFEIHYIQMTGCN